MAPPPPLHPRSRQTISLFTTTLALSFLLVGLPHLLPCPAPRTHYADTTTPSDPLDPESHSLNRRRPRQQRRQKAGNEVVVDTASEYDELRREAHECPVPKPDTILKTLVGYAGMGTRDAGVRPRVQVEQAEKAFGGRDHGGPVQGRDCEKGSRG